MDKNRLAINLALISTIFTGLYTPIVLGLKGGGFDSLEIVAIRSFMCAITVGIVLLIFKRESFRVAKKDIVAFVLIGLATMLYGALGVMAVDPDIGDLDGALSSLLQNTAPYFTIAFAYLFFGEKITRDKIIAVLVGFLGCVMATGVFNESIDGKALGIIIAVAGALFLSMASLGSKYVGNKGYKPETALFYFHLVTGLSLLPHMLYHQTYNLVLNASLETYGYMLAIGLISVAIPQFFIIKANQIGNSGNVGIARMFDIVTTAVFCWLLLGQTLDAIEILGLVVVMSSLIFLMRDTGRNMEKSKG